MGGGRRESEHVCMRERERVEEEWRESGGRVCMCMCMCVRERLCMFVRVRVRVRVFTRPDLRGRKDLRTQVHLRGRGGGGNFRLDLRLDLGLDLGLDLLHVHILVRVFGRERE